MPRTEWIRISIRAVTLAAAALLASRAHASVTLLLGEPFGRFGTMMPTGHTTIYLDRACADGPLKLRLCLPGEPAGVAFARYDHLGQADWIATPILPFLYATDRPEDALAYATPEAVHTLRESYREANLEAVFPDETEHAKQNSEWVETLGVVYDRRLWGYELATTEAQDEAVIAALNADANRHRYHLHRTNCADFAAGILNLYFPGAIHTDRVADFGITSPKQVARSLEAYAHAHPDLRLRVYELPQRPGSLRRSRPVRFGSEALLTTKRYLLTLCVIQPEAVLAILGAYLADGRWKVGAGADPMPNPPGAP